MVASFVLPPIHDNADGSWGPSPSMIPPQFKEYEPPHDLTPKSLRDPRALSIPYSPYSKSEKLGRFADWTDGDGSKSLATATSSGRARAAAGRGGRSGGDAPAGPPGAGAFGHFHVQDESSFSLVDTKAPQARRAAPSGFSRGRGTGRGGAPSSRGGATSGRNAGPGAKGGGRGPSRRGGARDWEKGGRTRESSIPISPEWSMLEELDFPRLSKLRLDVDISEPQTLGSYGHLYAYDKQFDRITPKSEKPLQIVERIRFNITTSEDPVMQELASKNTAKVYITDTILSWLMCCTRSVYPWDIVITHEGGKVFFDKRDGSTFDFITVNENAADPPMETDKDSINSPGSLSLEATFIDQHFSFQAVTESARHRLDHPNPFSNPSEREPLASCGYFYRLFDLGIDEEEDFGLAVRTQVEAFTPPSTARGKPHWVSLKTLNEFDSKAQGAGGAPDWRSRLDTQRGAVVATEMKNNSFKLSKYAVQSLLAGAEVIKIGYVSRVNPRDNSRHATLSATTMRPLDFATQLNISLSNGWGIVRMIADKVLKMPEGKYLLIKDPNKSIIRLYSVPASALLEEPEDLEGAEGEADVEE